MRRAHTPAAALLVAAVVLVPLGFWVYARVASVDRGSQVAHGTRLLRDAPPPVGARRFPLQVYEERAWEGESLVPISSYRVETSYRLTRPLVPARLVDHYRRALPGWRVDDLGLRDVTFTRGSDTIVLDLSEYVAPGARTLRSYGLIVSQ